MNDCFNLLSPVSLERNLNEIWDEISTDILKIISISTPFLLLGDMNARTGILSDMSNDDKFHVNSSVPPRHSIYTTRNIK